MIVDLGEIYLEDEFSGHNEVECGVFARGGVINGTELFGDLVASMVFGAL